MALRARPSNGSIRSWRRHFPLASVDSLTDMMREILFNSNFKPSSGLDSSLSGAARLNSSESTICVIEPDLTFVSIVLGFIENRLTNSIHEEPTLSSRLKPPVSPCSSFLKYSSVSGHDTSSSVSAIVHPSPLSAQTNRTDDALDGPPTADSPTAVDSPSFYISRAVDVITDTAPFAKTRAQRRRSVHRLSSSVREVGCSSQTNPPNAVLSVCVQSSGRPQLMVTRSQPIPVHKGIRSLCACPETISFPCLTFEEAERLYREFHTLITTSPKLQPFLKEPPSKSVRSNTGDSPRFATRALIRAVCEVLWTRMTWGKNREKVTHTQSIYSFLSSGIVDSFGLAYTAVAACQLLEYSDVYLALSEDHGWVEFGPPDARQTADVASWLQNVHIAHGHDCSSTAESHVLPSGGGIDQPSTNLTVFDDQGSPPPVRIPPWTHSWLYVNGYPVVCHPRILAVAAAIASLQPGSTVPVHNQCCTTVPLFSNTKSTHSTSTDFTTTSKWVRHLSTPAISMQLVTVKHRLLWLFYESGCLARYPLGLTNLADLEDAFPSPVVSDTSPDGQVPSQDKQTDSYTDNFCLPSGSPHSSIALRLYTEAVSANRKHYANQHVYPYTSLAGYLYRHDDHRGALHYWSEAAQVIGQYNHSSDDWEVYRELLEIATQLMPHMFRCAAEASRFCSDGVLATDPDGYVYQPSNILDDPQCLAYLLAFYDHLCLWEEGSPVPVLHVGWVDKLMINLTRFSKRARRLLCLSVDESKLSPSDGDVCSPTVVHTRRSEHLNLSPSITSLPKRSSTRRNRAPLCLNDSASPGPTGLAEYPLHPKLSLSLTVQTAFGDALVAPCAPASSSTPPIVLSSIENRIDGAKISGVDLFESKSGPSARTKSIGTSRNNLKTACPPSILNPDGNLPLSSRVAETIKPFACDGATELSAGLYGESHEKWTSPAELDGQSVSRSSSPTVEYSTDDFLSNLAEACDRRLLNPAFLWGMDPDTPFLPENVAPEDSFTRVLVSMDQSNLSLSTGSTNLFLTPPDSGGSFTAEKVPTHPSHSQCKLNSEFGSTENNIALAFFNGNARSVDETDILNGAVSDELVISASHLANKWFSTEGELVMNDVDPPLSLHSNTIPYECTNSDTTVESALETEQSTQSKSMEEMVVHLTLHSTKMISIVDLLRASRLNSSAIKLALTAQSQLCSKRPGLSSLRETTLAHV